MTQYSGQLAKMVTRLPENGEVEYAMRIGDEYVPMNRLLGETLHLTHKGHIFCLNCQRQIKKSYSGGFCFPCSQRLAQCDLCFMKPEICHFDQGTCREPEWGMTVCMQPHIVYLANSSGVKVGITRTGQVPTRWLDQGATQALPIFRVQTRYQSGLLEVMFKQHVSDRTDWRRMLKGEAEPVDLAAVRDKLRADCATEITELRGRFGDDAIEFLPAEQPVEINYPVMRYPEKIKSLNFDKTPAISGQLEGIKGQYLIFDTGVINIRKFTSYQVELAV